MDGDVGHPDFRDKLTEISFLLLDMIQYILNSNCCGNMMVLTTDQKLTP